MYFRGTLAPVVLLLGPWWVMVSLSRVPKERRETPGPQEPESRAKMWGTCLCTCGFFVGFSDFKRKPHIFRENQVHRVYQDLLVLKEARYVSCFIDDVVLFLAVILIWFWLGAQKGEAGAPGIGLPGLQVRQESNTEDIYRFFPYYRFLWSFQLTLGFSYAAVLIY